MVPGSHPAFVAVEGGGGSRRSPRDEDMELLNANIDYKVSPFLYLYSDFCIIHLVPYVHVII
jgi:hypothetical protein